MRIAIFGAGLIGRKHAEIAGRNSALAAIVDPNPESRELADGLGCAHFSTPEDCLEKCQLDGVIIATPNQLHVTHARQCIDKGIPTLIEKPIADKAAHATAMVQEAEAQGVPILVGHHRRHNAIVQRARKAIEEGALGRIVAASGHFLLYKPDDYFDVSWRREPGAGPIFINLIHDIDLLRYFVGEIVEVVAMQSSAARGFAVEDTASVLLRFETGALGTFSLSDAAVSPWSWEFTAGENAAYPHANAAAYQISGTHGALSVPDLRFWHHPETRGWWEPLDETTLEADHHDPLQKQFEHFCDVCRGAAPIVAGKEGLRSLMVVEAIKHSADSGAAVKLSTRD
ncbi:putative dehydrogenase [Shimia isoporae]|uniref:Putative dehydrogenase n=1 Tax=Shimia isoporae TaxID=647720 RepID=A0A4R1N3F5_9RHOB|nr:Gfo/Idh/MocA family oxidoreductase [Shimia isoporae]TCL01146.1 putative dehydrogenase [Shimia isoporae]